MTTLKDDIKSLDQIGDALARQEKELEEFFKVIKEKYKLDRKGFACPEGADHWYEYEMIIGELLKRYAIETIFEEKFRGIGTYGRYL